MAQYNMLASLAAQTSLAQSGQSADAAQAGVVARLSALSSNHGFGRLAIAFGASATARMQKQTTPAVESIILVVYRRQDDGSTKGVFKLLALDGSRQIKTRPLEVHGKAPRQYEFLAEEYINHQYVNLVKEYLQSLNLDEVGIAGWASVEELDKDITYLGSTVVPASFKLDAATKDGEFTALLNAEVNQLEFQLLGILNVREQVGPLGKALELNGAVMTLKPQLSVIDASFEDLTGRQIFGQHRATLTVRANGAKTDNSSPHQTSTQVVLGQATFVTSPYPSGRPQRVLHQNPNVPQPDYTWLPRFVLTGMSNGTQVDPLNLFGPLLGAVSVLNHVSMQKQAFDTRSHGGVSGHNYVDTRDASGLSYLSKADNWTDTTIGLISSVKAAGVTDAAFGTFLEELLPFRDQVTWPAIYAIDARTTGLWASWHLLLIEACRDPKSKAAEHIHNTVDVLTDGEYRSLLKKSGKASVTDAPIFVSNVVMPDGTFQIPGENRRRPLSELDELGFINVLNAMTNGRMSDQKSDDYEHAGKLIKRYMETMRTGGLNAEAQKLALLDRIELFNELQLAPVVTGEIQRLHFNTDVLNLMTEAFLVSVNKGAQRFDPMEGAANRSYDNPNLVYGQLGQAPTVPAAAFGGIGGASAAQYGSSYAAGFAPSVGFRV